MNPDPKKNTVDPAKSVHLSASAGSGKTRALKERYLALLNELDRRGLGLDQAVAITFTDKAAAEIKARVMRDLPETMLKKIVRGGSELRISTIHSFCMNLLKRYPLEAGLPPDFGVMDSRDQAYKIRKAIEEAIEESDRDFEIADTLRSHSLDELIEKTTYLLSLRSRLKRMEIDEGGRAGLLTSFIDGMALDAAETELTELLRSATWREIFSAMENLLRSLPDEYDSHQGMEHLALSQAQDLLSLPAGLDLITSLYFTKENKPRKAPKLPAKSFRSGGRQEEYRTLFFRVQELLSHYQKTYLLLQSGKESLAFLRLYFLAEERYRRSKLREGLLDFDDLEIFAYQLLQGIESADILYWLDRKILHVLVDEFQDTSDMQWAIVRKLTEELFAGQGADKPMPATLFVVGDEKQSIYRFREANYRLIKDVKEQMQRNIPLGVREIVTLDRNFRSTPEIISTVNSLFAHLWGASYAPSEAVRTGHAGSVRLIELHDGDDDDEAPNHQEAEVLATTIRTMVDEGTAVYEQANDSWTCRQAGFGDCAVLIQTRTKLKEYESALRRHGIPYRVIGGIGFYEELEIQALMHLLFFIRDRADDHSLAVALSSPLFGFAAEELSALMQEGKGLAEALRRRKPEAGALLDQWTGLSRFASLSVLLHRIVQDTGAYVTFGKENPQAVFNIDKLLDTAREFDRRGYTTLQDFVEWVKNLRSTEQREATSDMNLPGFEGSVSIMTVHKAKGLEYGIVFLPGMNQAARSLRTGPEALVQETGGKKRIAFRNGENPLYDELWKGPGAEQEELRREHQRLLYVAMTRARDHLVMIGSPGSAQSPREDTWLGFIHQGLIPRKHKTGSEKTFSYAFPDWEPRAVGRPCPGEMPEQDGVKPKVPRLDLLLENIRPLPLSETIEWKRATDFISKKFVKPGSPVRQDEETALLMTRGSILHRCLEEFTTAGTHDIDRAMQMFPETASLRPGAREELVKSIGDTLDSVLSQSDLAWIFKRREGSYSELPFLYRTEQALISGIMDRVVISEDIGYVIDYKAIRIDDEEALGNWIDLYRPQIQVYCAAAKELFGLKSVEGYLLFLDSNRLQLVCKT